MSGMPSPLTSATTTSNGPEADRIVDHRLKSAVAVTQQHADRVVVLVGDDDVEMPSPVRVRQLDVVGDAPDRIV